MSADPQTAPPRAGTTMKMSEDRAKLLGQEMGLDAPALPVGEADVEAPATWLITSKRPDGSCSLGAVEVTETLHLDQLAADFTEMVREQGGELGHATNLQTKNIIFLAPCGDAERLGEYARSYQAMKSQRPSKGFGKEQG